MHTPQNITSSTTSSNLRQFSFIGGSTGPWRISRITAVAGESLGMATRLRIVNEHPETPPTDASWLLRGITSNLRYTTQSESEQLIAKQKGLGRPHATRAALIPLKKSAAWWAMPQDTRRQIFEAQSRHTSIGLKYLPAIARRLHHAYDLGEPFDFLTWFEFAPKDEPHFDELLAELRSSQEWAYVDREVDIRLNRE